MNKHLLKMLMGMFSPEQFNEMFKIIAQKLIEYKNNFPLLPGEESASIVLFDKGGQLYATIATFDSYQKVTRQVETHLVSELFLKMLTQSENV